MKTQVLTALAVLSLAGCATVQIPSDRLEHAQASVRGAEELGALAVPAAKLHLQYAKDQTAAAKRMANDGDENAILMMARAEADAELALSLAREAQTRSRAQQALEVLDQLRSREMP